MQKFCSFNKPAPRVEQKKLDFLPTRKEFFTTFWFPVFDKAKELGLTDAEAEHTTELIFEELSRDGHLDGSTSIYDQMLQLIRFSAWFVNERRRPRGRKEETTRSALPASEDYYMPQMIRQRLVRTLERFWEEREACDVYAYMK
jgi:hypothetical protein